MTARRMMTALTALLATFAAPAAFAGHDDDHFRVGVGVYAPRPAEARHHGPAYGRGRGHRCEYIPGHHEARTVQVYVPGFWREEFVPPVYREVYGPCGTYARVMVRPGYVTRVFEPGRYETRVDTVWVPGFWACGCRHHR